MTTSEGQGSSGVQQVQHEAEVSSTAVTQPHELPKLPPMPMPGDTATLPPPEMPEPTPAPAQERAVVPPPAVEVPNLEALNRQMDELTRQRSNDPREHIAGDASAEEEIQTLESEKERLQRGLANYNYIIERKRELAEEELHGLQGLRHTFNAGRKWVSRLLAGDTNADFQSLRSQQARESVDKNQGKYFSTGEGTPITKQLMDENMNEWRGRILEIQARIRELKNRINQERERAATLQQATLVARRQENTVALASAMDKEEELWRNLRGSIDWTRLFSPGELRGEGEAQGASVVPSEVSGTPEEASNVNGVESHNAADGTGPVEAPVDDLDTKLQRIAEISAYGRAVEIRRNDDDTEMVLARMMRFTEQVVDRHMQMAHVAENLNSTRVDMLDGAVAGIQDELMQMVEDYRQQAYEEENVVLDEDLQDALMAQRDIFILAAGVNGDGTKLKSFSEAVEFAKKCRSRATLYEPQMWNEKAAVVEKLCKKADKAAEKFRAAQKRGKEAAEKKIIAYLEGAYVQESERRMKEVLAQVDSMTEGWEELTPEERQLVTKEQYSDSLDQSVKVLSNIAKWKRYFENPDEIATELAQATFNTDKRIAQLEKELEDTEPTLSAKRGELRRAQAELKKLTDSVEGTAAKMREEKWTSAKSRKRNQLNRHIATLKEQISALEASVQSRKEGIDSARETLKGVLREMREELPVELRGETLFTDAENLGAGFNQLAEVYNMVMLTGKANAEYQVGGNAYRIENGLVDPEKIRKEFDDRVKELGQSMKERERGNAETAQATRELVELFDGSVAQYKEAVERLKKLPPESLANPTPELVSVLADMGINHVDRLQTMVSENLADGADEAEAKALARVLRAVAAQSQSDTIKGNFEIFARALEK